MGPAFLNGSNGSDAFLIFSGGTTANGGAGNDSFELEGNPGAVKAYGGLQLDGGDGFDRLVVSGDYQLSSATIANVEALTFQQDLNPGALSPHLTIDTASTGTQPVIQIEGNGSITLDLSTRYFSGAGVIFAAGATVAIEIHGTVLADVITGTSADDSVYGDAGNDLLRGPTLPCC